MRISDLSSVVCSSDLAVAAQLADELGLHLERGKMVAELSVGGNDKGFAVRKLMEHPRMSGSRPLFIGDDLTDEAGFEAARELGGAGILVGERLPTAEIGRASCRERVCQYV